VLKQSDGKYCISNQQPFINDGRCNRSFVESSARSVQQGKGRQETVGGARIFLLVEIDCDCELKDFKIPPELIDSVCAKYKFNTKFI
jgi:hypothetical protein